MRRLAFVLAVLLLARPAAAGEPGDFAYYVLALSWNAAWCAAKGDARGALQCEPRSGIGFILHGLWPQHEGGWPEFCATPHRDPSRAETAAMAGLMGSAGLARYQWRKHGSCSGLAATDYFVLARQAWEAVRRPALLRRIAEPLRLAPEAVEAAFLAANPALFPEAISVTCRDGMIREVRICLSRDLAPRSCTGPAVRECPASEALFPPMR